jgi:hypothetical protein
MGFLHFGKHLLAGDATRDDGVRKCKVSADLIRVMEAIAEEAAGCQRLPALRMSGDHEKWLREKWAGPVLTLSAHGPDLAALCDYPASKVLRHGWIHPERERLAAVDEPSPSTDATAEAVRGPMVHQLWIGPNELPPRLAGYCETMRHAFPGWDYKLWREADMAGLAEKAGLPAVVRGEGDYNIGLRADVVRLEILRQHGGVYWDTDFEALRPDLTPLFAGLQGFAYADQKSGSPANGFMAAARPGDPVVEVFLRRVAARIPAVQGDPWKVVSISGPGALRECLGLWVVAWNPCGKTTVAGQDVAVSYAGGTVTAYHQEVIYPYHYEQGSWATFDPALYPLAWTAHHWEGAWHGRD